MPTSIPPPPNRPARYPGVERTLRALLSADGPAANGLLAIALESGLPPLRIGAGRVLMRRGDPAAHRQILDAWARLAADAQAAILAEANGAGEASSADPTGRAFRQTLAEALLGAAGPAARVALTIARRGEVTDALATIVQVASQPSREDAAAFARAAAELATRLRLQVDAITAGGKSRLKDPAFARRAAVNAAAVALGSYADHRRPELLDVLLELAPADEPALLAALRNPAHVAHQALLERLRRHRGAGVGALFAGLLQDVATPPALLELIAERTDAETLGPLFERLGERPGARVQQNARTIRKLAWVEREPSALPTGLSDAAAISALRFVAESGVSRRRFAALLAAVLHAAPEGGATAAVRLAACEVVRRLPDHLALAPLSQAVADPDGSVAAMAVGLLRSKNYPRATQALVERLDHPSAEVRHATQRELREFSYAAFRDLGDELTPDERRRMGALVGKADPLAPATLAAELRAGAAPRRVRAVGMVEELLLVDELRDTLIGLLDDRDAGVRAAAAESLGAAGPERPVVAALGRALSDRSIAVRKAADASLQRLGARREAEFLIEANA